MTEQLEKIILSSDYIKSNYPKGFNPKLALITNADMDILSDFKTENEIGYDMIPPLFTNRAQNPGKILFAKCKGNDIIVYKGRFHYYDGINMREIGHMIYVLKHLGINKIISIDEVGHFNPRFNCGEIALIYDHINLMGDNPLIGKNDNELGLRFPDMSNAYDRELYNILYQVLQEKMVKINESVLLGTIGPQSETEAEARFYRDAGADVVGYSIVPENITSVHSNIKFAAIGLITRELVADRMMEDKRSENQRVKHQTESRKKSERILSKVLIEMLDKI